MHRAAVYPRAHAADRGRVIAGARLDRASAKDYRARIGSGMMSRPNPTLDKTRADTLPSGFVRYELDMANSFNDFIDATRGLVKRGFGQPGRRANTSTLW